MPDAADRRLDRCLNNDRTLHVVPSNKTQSVRLFRPRLTYGDSCDHAHRVCILLRLIRGSSSAHGPFLLLPSHVTLVRTRYVATRTTNSYPKIRGWSYKKTISG